MDPITPLNAIDHIPDVNGKQTSRGHLKVRLKLNKNGECEIQRDHKKYVQEVDTVEVKQEYDDEHDNDSEATEICDEDQPVEDLNDVDSENQQQGEPSSSYPEIPETAPESQNGTVKSQKKKRQGKSPLKKDDKEKKTMKKEKEKKTSPEKKDKPRVIHQCGECGKRFQTKSGYTTHSMEHTGLRPFTCEECGKGFKRSVHLRDHMTIHTGQKRHMCPDCGKSFTVNSSLKIHMMTHSGEKPHMCNECGRCFTRSSDMLKHLRGHSGEKPYICPDCGKTFARKQHMDSHMDTQHKNIKNNICTDCGKSFYRPRQLEIHMRSHSGERPFLCYLCGKGFASNSTLQEHLRTHADNQLEHKRKNSERKRKMREKKKLEKLQIEAEKKLQFEVENAEKMAEAAMGGTVDFIRHGIDFARIENYVNQVVKEEDLDLCSSDEDDDDIDDIDDKDSSIIVDNDDGQDNGLRIEQNIDTAVGMRVTAALPKLETTSELFLKRSFHNNVIGSIGAEMSTDSINNKTGDTSLSLPSTSYSLHDRMPRFPTNPAMPLGFDFVGIDNIGNVCTGSANSDSSSNSTAQTCKNDRTMGTPSPGFLL